MRKNVASQVVGAQMVSASDGSAFTGSVTVHVTGNGGTQATGSVGSGACTHEGNGFHTYAPAQAETNYDHVAFTFVGTGAVPTTIQIYTSFPQTGDTFALVGTAGAGLTAVPWNASWDAEVQSECTDALNAYDPPTKTEMDTAFTEIKGATWATTDTLEAIRDRGDAAWTTATGFSTLDAAGVRGAVGLASANLDTQLADLPTAAENADAVWDETLSGHLGAGSTGNALNAAGSAGDPWATALPGAYGAGTAGLIIGNNLNATVSSRATQTSVDTVDDLLDTEVAAIKAKTDNLPADPADASDIAASFATVNGTLATVAGYLDTEIAAIKAKTDNLPASPAAVGSAMTLAVDAMNASALSADAVAEIQSGLSTLNAAGVRTAVGLASANLDTQLDAIPTANENADALLKRDWTAVTGEAARSVLNAMRFLRNKWAVAGSTLTVTKEDDTTAAWTGAVTTDAAADPITGNDPT